MKLSRLHSSAIGMAIVVISSLALAAPASAAPDSNVSFITAAEIDQAATDGEPGWNEYSGQPLTSSVSGLSAPGSSEFAYGLTPYLDASSATALSDLLAGSSFYASGNGDDVYAEIALFDENGDAAYMQSTVPGTADLIDVTTEWFLYNTIGALSAGNSYQLDAIQDELATNIALADWEVVSFGFAVDDAADIYTASVNGQSFSFLPTPVSTAPTTVTPASFAADGVMVTTNGFIPGEIVEVAYSYFVGGVEVSEFDPLLLTPDANGAVSYTLRLPAGTTPDVGSANITFLGQSGVQTFSFAVAPAAVVTPNVTPNVAPNVAILAATGTDAVVPVVAGGVLLLGGAALAIVAVARRRAI